MDSFDPKPKLNINTGSGVFARPSLGAWTLYGLGSENQNLPGFISLSPSLYHGGAQNYGSAFLPATFQGTRSGDGGMHFREARLSGLAPGQHPTLQRLQSADGIGAEPTDEFGRQCLLADTLVVFATEFGYYVTENKVTMPDFHATILHTLGLDHEQLTFRHAGRDDRLTDVQGRVVREILV